MRNILVTPQYSNYDAQGRFILEADSTWQMCTGRIRELLKLNPYLQIDITGPHRRLLITQPELVSRDLFESQRVTYVPLSIIPNALATRFDFDWISIAESLRLDERKSGTLPKYEAVYVNDPMTLRAFKAIFQVRCGYQPKFYVHSHFVDVPSCPKFPVESSLWLGQCEAAIRADYNFWQCQSALNEFEREARKVFRDEVVDAIMVKSSAWDDGFSRKEAHRAVDYDKVRFTRHQFEDLVGDKTIVFVPNRVGGRGRSSDYTNCGKFLFDVLPRVRELRQDFVVIAGNPSQKFSNQELIDECGKNGLINLVPDSLTRDEYLFVAGRSHITVGLYDQDTYGSTASRECIEKGSVPLWIDCNEYSRLTQKAQFPKRFIAKSDFSDIIEVTDRLLAQFRQGALDLDLLHGLVNLRKLNREQCSYESTTLAPAKIMNLLP